MGWKSIGLDAVAELLWPSQCPVCQGESGDGRVWVRGRWALIHRSCLERLQLAPRPLELAVDEQPKNRIAVRWLYRDGPEFFRVLHCVKYHGQWPHLECFAGMWLEFVARETAALPEPHFVPLPDDPGRRRTRGGSVVEWLAGVLERGGLGKAEPRILARRRAAPPQARIESAARREANVSTLFRVGDLSRVPPGATLVLLDDQITTGATIRAASSLLGLRGHRVRVLALAGAGTAPQWLDP